MEPIAPTGSENELQNFYSLLEKQFVAPEHEYDFICTNALQNYRTKTLTIQIENNHVYTATLHYRVLRCDSSYFLTHPLKNDDETNGEWKGTLFFSPILCMECFSIIPSSQTLCPECYCMRIMYHFGIFHQYTSSVPVCSICFDQVFFSRLHCGHYVHKTCFIKMNSSSWYDYDAEYKCPICRTVINEEDKLDFFLSYSVNS